MKSIVFLDFARLVLIVALCGQSSATKNLSILDEACISNNYKGHCQNSVYKRENLHMICRTMICASIPVTTAIGYVGKSIGPAPDGTPCGEPNREFCLKGVCRYYKIGQPSKIVVRYPESEYICRIALAEHARLLNETLLAPIEIPKRIKNPRKMLSKLDEECISKNYQGHCRTSVYKRENLHMICRTMICATTTSTITRGFLGKSIGQAPDGTPCGTAKSEICLRGQCINDTSRLIPRIQRYRGSEYKCHVAMHVHAKLLNESKPKTTPKNLSKLDVECILKNYQGHCTTSVYRPENLYMICQTMICATTTPTITTGYVGKSIGPAPDGTPCGTLDSEICLGGQCVNDTLGKTQRIQRYPESEYRCRVAMHVHAKLLKESQKEPDRGLNKK